MPTPDLKVRIGLSQAHSNNQKKSANNEDFAGVESSCSVISGEECVQEDTFDNCVRNDEKVCYKGTISEKQKRSQSVSSDLN